VYERVQVSIYMTQRICNLIYRAAAGHRHIRVRRFSSRLVARAIQSSDAGKKSEERGKGDAESESDDSWTTLWARNLSVKSDQRLNANYR